MTTGREPTEWVAGRLLYMPPCGQDQQGVATEVTGILRDEAREAPCEVDESSANKADDLDRVGRAPAAAEDVTDPPVGREPFRCAVAVEVA